MAAVLEGVHPVLMVHDVPTSIRYYERLGFSETFRDDAADPKYAAIARDGVELHLQWHDANQWACSHDRPTYRFPVREVDVLYADFRAKGAVTAQADLGGPWQAPADTPWNTREFHLRDPDGNGLQFYNSR